MIKIVKLPQKTGIHLTAPKGFAGKGINQSLRFLISPFDGLVSFFRRPLGKSNLLEKGRLCVKRPLHFQPVHENTRPVPIGIDLPDIGLSVNHLIASLLHLKPKVAGSVQWPVIQFDHLVLMGRSINPERSQHPALVVHADESTRLGGLLVDPRK